jgi:uncharacterized protein
VPNLTILLPPSESKASGGTDNRSWLDIARIPELNAFSELDETRHILFEDLHRALEQPVPALEKLFRVRGHALEAALEANWRLPGGPVLAAVRRYTGVMYDYLDYVNMAPTTRQAFEGSAILFSAAWGLLRPTDLIPDYKLKMDAKLPRLGRVSAFWKPQISSTLNRLLQGHVVWDLLPGAHRQAWDGRADMSALWRVRFVQSVEKNGQTTVRTVSHWSKALKGSLVRFLCERNIADPAECAEFEHPEGYAFAPHLSDLGERGGEVVFIQPME